MKWIKSGNWKVDEKFALKTLTDISPYKDFCKKLESIVFAENKDKYCKDDFLSEVFIEEEKYDAIYELLKRKRNIILQGAPGVGKTFAAKRLAYSIMGSVDDSRIEMIQFHQNYSYEDFVLG